MEVISAPEFIRRVCSSRQPTWVQIGETVKRIIAAVKEKGDAAVLQFEAEFGFAPKWLRVPADEIKGAASRVPAELRKALRIAAERIREYHESLPVPRSCDVKVGEGRIRFTVEPLEKVGVYVPGGRASYPSTMLMTAIPARVAGVKEIVVCTPPGPDGIPAAATLAAAVECGVDSIFCCGGAQAIAAMAYGTETIPKVNKIVGPGNAFVTAAKKEVYGVVDIDGLAGPSELMVAIGNVGDRVLGWALEDLRAQAEHDPQAVCVAVTTSHAIAEKLSELSGDVNGYIVFCETGWTQGLEVIEHFAPEHLELLGEDAKHLAGKVRSAGAVLVGPFSPVAAGDYMAGPSHVLPTGGSARSFSGLWTGSFLRSHSVMELTRQELGQLLGVGETLAVAEGLRAHARSFTVRRDSSRGDGL
ncbi:MAG TPA: histidinol dehydrogenase [Firmicutes bacterium]|nr:histidinol dehydrogenase [Bacillota bacterium]